MIDIRINDNKTLPPTVNFTSFCTQLAKELNLDKEFIEINFVTQDVILDINKQYLNHDYVTDIITFNLGTVEKIEGDIYICTERAKENAIDWGCTFEDELKRLIIHGFLHLLDFTDYTDKEKEKMTIKENELLEKLRKSECE
tara:strand:+ start:6362 stop:6787 length:426 start_codon:yes stop_codon:yes gene_type:complete